VSSFQSKYKLSTEDLYWEVLDKFPLLSSSEELSLAQKKNSLVARNTLILHNLRLVISISQRYAKSRQQFIELVQEGNLGLIRAADRFRPELGYRFSTYATWWIRQAVLRALINQDRLIRLPESALDTLHQINKVREIFYKDLGRKPDSSEISRALNMDEKRLNKMLLLQEQVEQIVFFDTLSTEDSAEEKNNDLISSNYMSPLSLVEENLSPDMQQQLIDNFKLLSDREKNILQMRFGLNLQQTTHSLSEISNKLHLSIERVRQIQKQALKKLRKNINQ